MDQRAEIKTKLSVSVVEEGTIYHRMTDELEGPENNTASFGLRILTIAASCIYSKTCFFSGT